MTVEKSDLEGMQKAITKHMDDTILPIQKQVDKNQKRVEDLYEKDTSTQVALAEVQGEVNTVDVKHDGKHQEIKSSAKTAYIIIGLVLTCLTIVIAILAYLK